MLVTMITVIFGSTKTQQLLAQGQSHLLGIAEEKGVAALKGN